MGGTLNDHFYCLSPEKVTSSSILLLDNFPLYIKLKNCNLIINNTKNKNKYIKYFFQE